MQDLQPVLPSTLQAELRDYQIDGFRWLSRLAHWGVGACLADDMGLGKTLQALAVILNRAPAGPTLILAPTSVCANWISEVQRFAPTLNIVQFGSGDATMDRQSQRQALLEGLQPFDMLVCSYGLLQQEEVAEIMAKVEWQTIVLDEAQAIKNFATKRSQAAMNLQGGFKLITTGTPIENHLGELWNLFRFINPGLLGSLERFNQNFANPIERSQDKPTRLRLKKLIQPFLLRRTKSQVLAELPSRTEILLHVELSQDEMALYEALRREAIAKLANSDATAGAKHLQVLAEIMKLRRVCCNPRLVMPDSPFPSAKLQLFGEVLAELLENRHKALVFSQFVDHLRIIRDYLDEQKISYQYLDGSTPAKERKKRVDAFQAGEGDVFLISLKAGGTGLNLTAADYVIHMDPWWNPAVEDQASDRAHRIGQQRPVTIYRLVAKHTIEEKIVDLHQHKRDLADSLLEGAEVSGKISTDELLKLIQTS
jgi:SNF2 family DNA or RNA helicase